MGSVILGAVALLAIPIVLLIVCVIGDWVYARRDARERARSLDEEFAALCLYPYHKAAPGRRNRPGA